MERIAKKNPNTEKYWNETAINGGFLEDNFDHFINSPRDIIYEIVRHINYGEKVLDVGAGSGMITRWVKFLRPNVYMCACDYSKPAVEWLKEKIPLNRVFWCDIREGIKEPDKSFDVIINTEMLEHMDKPEEAVKELVRLAKNKVIISVPFRDNSKVSTQHVWSFGFDDVYNLLSPYGIVHMTAVCGQSNIVGVCYIGS